MNNDLKIYCINTQEYIDITGGETVLDVYDSLKHRLNLNECICARVNNRTEDLRFPIYAPKQIEFLPMQAASSQRVYVSSLCMILSKAVADLYPGQRLIVEHSIAGGYYCKFKHNQEGVTKEQVAAIKKQMREIVDANLEFVRQERRTTDVVEMFRRQGQNDKLRLLSG